MPSNNPMDAKAYNTALTELRGVRDDIKAVSKDLEKLQRELQQLASDRDKRIAELATYEKAKADRIAPAACDVPVWCQWVVSVTACQVRVFSLVVGC
ncbi:hypothetical protein ACWDZ6_31530 [Streptomyces sp. NPDC002926]